MHACSQRGRISWMFWPMRSQRQLPHQTPRALPRLPLTPPAQGQNVFSSTVFCLRAEHETMPHSFVVAKDFEHQGSIAWVLSRRHYRQTWVGHITALASYGG